MADRTPPGRGQNLQDPNRSGEERKGVHPRDGLGADDRAKVACSECSLGELCLPRGLSDPELKRFETLVSKSRPLHGGEHLFHAGDAFENLVAVRTGCFKSYVLKHDGEEQVVGFHLPGEIIGLDAIHIGHHPTNVVALDTGAVCALSFNSVTDMSRRMPGLQSELFRVMSQRIGELEKIASDMSADQRIALFLCSISERFCRRGYSEKEFMLAMSRSDIASYLRLATETVSRVLARFQKQGLVEVDRKHVRLPDLEGLRRIAGQSSP